MAEKRALKASSAFAAGVASPATAASPMAASPAVGLTPSAFTMDLAGGLSNAGTPRRAAAGGGGASGVFSAHTQLGRGNASLQRGVPAQQEEIRRSLDDFLDVKLPRLEALGKEFFDDIANALSPRADNSKLEADLESFRSTLLELMSLVRQNGLGGIDVSSSSSSSVDDTSRTSRPGESAAAAITPSNQARLPEGAAATPLSFEELSRAAKVAFERRSRLVESAGIVRGILDPAIIRHGPS